MRAAGIVAAAQRVQPPSFWISGWPFESTMKRISWLTESAASFSVGVFMTSTVGMSLILREVT